MVMSPSLELKSASKSYVRGLLLREGPPALHPFSLRLHSDKPRIVAVVGESGSGKSTLGNMLLGLLRPTSGAVCYAGQDIWSAPKALRDQFRRDVQAVTQDPFAAYNPFYKVDHALIVPIRQFKLASNGKAITRMMQEACVAVGLNPDDTLGRYPHQLSGGQRQRLMVARALMLRPKVLVADEPVSMVDASLRATILNNVAQLRREHGVSVVYITHDIITAYHIADEVYVLHKGRVVEVGDVEDVITRPSHAYTRLLVSSIPWPDPGLKWGETDDIVAEKAALARQS
jgi:ABC-type oligopeptide transport system ATPase subunit